MAIAGLVSAGGYTSDRQTFGFTFRSDNMVEILQWLPRAVSHEGNVNTFKTRGMYDCERPVFSIAPAWDPLQSPWFLRKYVGGVA